MACKSADAPPVATGASANASGPGDTGDTDDGWTATGDGGELPCLEPPDLRFVQHTGRLGPGAMGGVLADDCVGAKGPLVFECNGESISLGAAVGDYDGDGLADLVLTDTFGPGRLLRNTGNGEFEVIEDSGIDFQLPASGAGWFDADKDGDLDLYLLTWASTAQRYYRNLGDGSFEEDAAAVGLDMPAVNYRASTSMAIGDYDLDGWPDVFVSGWDAGSGESVDMSRLFRNLGPDQPGHFEDVTEAAGVEAAGRVAVGGLETGFKTFSPALIDLDGDDHPELIVVADFGAEHIYQNLGDGSFVDPGESAGVGKTGNGMGLAVGDIDNDSDLDYMAGALSNIPQSCEHYEGKDAGNRLYLNRSEPATSTLAFDVIDHLARASCGAWSWGTAFADVDNDGDLDIAQTNGWYEADGSSTVYEQDPDRLWINPGDPLAGMEQCHVNLGFDDDGQGRALVVFDIDDDGDLDFIVTRAGASPLVYENDGGDELGSSLRVQLRGTESNTTGRGARVAVRVSAGGDWQVGEVGQATHFLGHSELVAHFGLGPEVDVVDEVRVCWPVSGRMQVLNAVGANQLLSLNEDDAEQSVDGPCAQAVVAD